MKRLLGAIWAVCVAAAAVAAPTDKPPFFLVSGEQGQAWLLGSVHVGQPDFYPFAEVIEQAFAESAVLALEADTNDPQLPQKLQPYLFAKQPLPAPLASKLSQFCQSRAMQCDPALAPWILSSQLLMAEMANSGFHSDQGVEHYFSNRLGSKSLWELEGMALQLRVFDGLSTDTQHAMLEGAMEPMDVDELIQAWRSGDQKTLARLTYDDMAQEPEAWQALMVNRNQGMARTLSDWLTQDDRLFVVVGAGHLVGEQSIPALLKQQGLTVTNCWQQACVATD
ncbi:TraB/GumN family protein [Ferrimonas sp. SCSIO 43195]|uniref:TraB/GumN family protein n=1 Tax=Ferrimonas sp. SCSIO 43195 TaxID=2822844 RepID=UPI0020763EC4|nr:TraB/GumN family protein [Ferrimonas sp. SCSIO 43195]USD37117.1 TraB/GumN family protein [Ferrimonas sp. SCSIO 43195]